MGQFLTKDGLSHFWLSVKSKLNAKVDKVDGKQLSSNDYTTVEKNKLAGLSNYSHPTTSGNKHIPAGGAEGKILGWASDGTAQWVDDKNTTYGDATQSARGLMTAADKTKLNGIASGANKTVVDSTISQSSTNPVQNGVITKRLQFLYSFKISRDKWDESSDKLNWNVIVPWSDSKGTAINATASSAMPNLTTNMSLGPAMMERTSSLSDNIILSGELSMINQGQIYVCDTNKLSFTVKRRPVCDLMLYFYARQWTT